MSQAKDVHSFDTEIGEIIIEDLTSQDWSELDSIIETLLDKGLAKNVKEATLIAFHEWAYILAEIFKGKAESDKLH